MSLASVRVVIGFVMLCAMTLLWDWRGLLSLTVRDVATLGLVGILGVFSYLIAASGLMRTSVTHYALIYSLLPSITAMLSVLMGREKLGATKVVGITLSLVGCSIAVSSEATALESAIDIGDALVLLFTLMMSAHIVYSAGIVKRFGVMVANTVMFGSSAVMLFAGSWFWVEPQHAETSPLVALSVVYIGIATAAVFLLRYRALQALSPATVGTYHNLIPICTILSANFLLGEPLGFGIIIGSGTVVAGAELVRRAHFPQWVTAPPLIKSAWRLAVSPKPSR